MAWINTYRELVSANAAIDKLTRPILRGEITSIALGGRGPGLPNRALVVFLRVVNTGAPSVIAKWEVAAIYGDGRVVQTYPIILTDATKTVTLTSESGGGPIVLTPEDDLASKTVQDAIPSGGARVGHLITVFRDPNVDPDKVERIRVSFFDVNGAPYQVEVDRRTAMTDYPPGGSPHMPGFRRPQPK